MASLNLHIDFFVRAISVSLPILTKCYATEPLISLGVVSGSIAQRTRSPEEIKKQNHFWVSSELFWRLLRPPAFCEASKQAPCVSNQS